MRWWTSRPQQPAEKVHASLSPCRLQRQGHSRNAPAAPLRQASDLYCQDTYRVQPPWPQARSAGCPTRT
eukprot:12884756-Prorocentrum_lima.AAC.1